MSATTTYPYTFDSISRIGNDNVAIDQRNIQCERIISKNSFEAISEQLFIRKFSRITQLGNFIDCGDKYGIIFEHNGNLFQWNINNGLVFNKMINVSKEYQIWMELLKFD